MDVPAGTTNQDQRLTVVEVIAYAGTAIALVGTGGVVGAFTSGSRGVSIVVSAIVALALFAVGWLTGDTDRSRLQLLRSVEWFLSISALQAFFMALIEPKGKGALFLVLLLTTIGAFPLWWLLRRTLQQLALAAAAFSAVIVLTVPDSFGFGPPDLTLTAIVTIALGVAWFVLGERKIVEPRRTAMVIGAVTALVGTLMFAADSQEFAFALLAVAGAGALVVGNMLDDRAVAGIGIVGLLLGSALLFGTIVEGKSGSLVSLLVGVALLVIAMVLARSWGHVSMRMPPLPGSPGGAPPPSAPPPDVPTSGTPPSGMPPSDTPPPSSGPPSWGPPSTPPPDDGGFGSG